MAGWSSIFQMTNPAFNFQQEILFGNRSPSRLRIASSKTRPWKSTLLPGEQYSAHSAFTLVELLVVIAVIGLLVALAAPVLAKARTQALRVVCTGNLRQIGLALQEYLSDFRHYPTFQAEGAHGTRTGFWDYKLLAEAGGRTRIFLCPANMTRGNNDQKNWWPTRPASITDPSALAWPNLSYGYNGTGTAPNPFPLQLDDERLFLGFGGEGGLGTGSAFLPTYLSESDVVAPADMIAIADYDPAVTDDDYDDDRHPEMLLLGLTGYHSSVANVLFCDTHVEHGKKNQWTMRTQTEWRRWNYDNQSHL